jgi:hypothetical protein
MAKAPNTVWFFVAVSVGAAWKTKTLEAEQGLNIEEVGVDQTLQ